MRIAAHLQRRYRRYDSWPLIWRKSTLGSVTKITPIEQIAAVERVPNTLSYGLLKLHPDWDSLRGDRAFRENCLLARTEVVGKPTPAT